MEVDDTRKTREELLLEVAGLRSQLAAAQLALNRRATDANRSAGTQAEKGPHAPAELLRDVILLEGVLNATDDIVFVKDLSGRYLLTNKAGVKLFGRPAEQIVGLTDADLFPETAETLAKVRADDEHAMSLPAGQSVRFRETVHTTLGVRHYLTTKSAYRDAQGRVIGVIGVARDVTELVAANEELQQDIVERQRVEQALRASETTLRKLADTLPQMVWVTRPDGFHEYFNRRWYEFTGVPEGSTDGEGWNGMFHADDQERATACWRHSLATGEPYEIEYRLRHRGGQYRWQLGRALPLRDESGTILKWVGTCTDIHDAKVAQEEVRRAKEQLEAAYQALRETEERYRLVNRVTTDVIWDWNLSNNELLWNTGLQDTFDYDVERIKKDIGWWYDHIHPDDRERVVTGIHAVIDGGGEIWRDEYRFRRHDGSYAVVLDRGHVARDLHGRPIRMVGAVVDQTERLAAEAALRASEERFRQLADAMPQIVWTADPEGKIDYFNRRWPEYTGLGAERLLGNQWVAVLHPEDLPEAVRRWEHSVIAATSYENEHRFRRYDGEYRWHLARGVPVRDDNGKIVRWFGTCTDIHEQKLTRIALAHAREEAERANRAKDEFLAALSHELRTPLAPVLMATQLIEQDPGLSDETREDLRMIRRNVEIETRLIDDMLDLTRVARGKIVLNRTVVDVHDVLQHAVETCRDDIFTEKRLQIEVQLGAESHWVSADAARLGQVFWNLVKNAAKFTPANGRISISTRNRAPGKIEVIVADTGIGITADALPHVFDAFEQGGSHVTRQFGGLGLGLAISRTLTELHGGIITASSEGPGRGATFTVELCTVEAPVAARAATETADVHTGALSKAGGGKRLLLVEDNEHTGRVLSRLLGKMGYVVHWANGHAEALAAALDQPFDLVVSDLGLPDGSGHELMRELQEHYGLRGIALSGFGMEADVARSRESGFVEHLVKPITVDRLAAVIQQLLG